MAGHERLANAGLTEREAEVLLAVGERLGNRSIADRLHLSVRTVESHVAALRRKLGITDREALAEAGQNLRRSTGAAAVPATPLTSLVGREREAGELATLLREHRLVTLTGPAGIGKTRLASHVATLHADELPDGARLADLAPVDRTLVGDTLARALGVVPRLGFPVRDTLREAAGGLRCLLLVDNCEHVIGEAAELVAEVLAASSHLRVLATSREPLGVPGEVTYPVPALPVPGPDAAPDAAAAAEFDGIRLFVERATQALPSFTLTDEATPAVSALCRRLDGLPLAIELAASRVRSYGPAEMVAHLDQRFELLSGGRRAVPPRHRALRAAIDWSYRLLDDAERALFDRLGVFTADFDYRAVQSVAADNMAAAVVALLPRLVDKSLVIAIRDGARYRLLETIRAYAIEQLTGSGAADDTERRHAAHYLDLAEGGAEKLQGSDQRAWLDRLTAEQPNLRAGLGYALRSGDLDTAWRWIAALERFWDVTGQRREAYEWIQRVLAGGEPPANAAGATGVAAASMLLRPVDSRAGFELAQRAYVLAVGLDGLTRARAARALGTTAIWVRPELVQPSLHEALAWLGQDQPWETALALLSLASNSGTLTDALRWAREAAGLFRGVGDTMYAANTLFIMAQRAMYAGIADEAVEQWLVECQALADAAGSEDDRAHAVVGFAQLAWLRGEHAHAAKLMEQCLPTLRRLNDERCTARALYVLGTRAHQLGRLEQAEELLVESIRAVALAGQVRVFIDALDALAHLAAERGRPRKAAVLTGAGQTARESAAPHMRPTPPSDGRLRQRLIRALGSEAFDEAYREGERLTATQLLQRTRDPKIHMIE